MTYALHPQATQDLADAVAFCLANATARLQASAAHKSPKLGTKARHRNVTGDQLNRT